MAIELWVLQLSDKPPVPHEFAGPLALSFERERFTEGVAGGLSMYDEHPVSEEVEWLGSLQGQVSALRRQVDALLAAHAGCPRCEEDGRPAKRELERWTGKAEALLKRGEGAVPSVSMAGRAGECP